MDQEPDQQTRAQLEAVVTRYLVDTKKWAPKDFRIEHKGTTPDELFAVCWGVYLDDERNPSPGGGKSVVLHVDLKQRRVVEERGFQ